MLHLSFNDKFYHICFFYMIINKNKHRSLTIRFMNNSLFYNNTERAFNLHDSTSANQSTFYNNIISLNGSLYSTVNTNAQSNIVADNNLYYNNYHSNELPNEGSSTITGQDPNFVNTTAGDFHLQSTSPAINKGKDLSAFFNYDYENTSRPQGAGWDMGPYEFH